VLELLGAKIDRGRIPFLPHLRDPGEPSKFWPAIVDRVLSRPVLSCVLSAGFLVVLALPALHLRVSAPGDEALAAKNEPVLRTLWYVGAGFPNAAPPVWVLGAVPPSEQPAGARAAKRVEALGGVRGVARPPFTDNLAEDGSTGSVELPLASASDLGARRAAI